MCDLRIGNVCLSSLLATWLPRSKKPPNNMRSASLDRRRKEPQPRLAPQVMPLAGPQTSQHHSELLKLHARLKTVVGKLIDFVSLTSDLLTSQRLPESSLTTQKRLLDELEQEKGRWEQYMFYCLSVQDDVLKNTPHIRLPESSLGSSPSDFKRISDLVAEAQNKVTVALRRKREDSGLNSKVWEAFTSLTQRIYESFFRAPEARRSQDDEALKRLEEEAERLRGRVRDLDLQLVEASGQLKSKDLELQSLQRLGNVRSAQFASSVEGDLQRVKDRNFALEAENERLKGDLEASGRRFNQSASFKSLKRELDRKTANIDEYLTQARPLAMSDLEFSRLKNEYELALHEVQQLREWKRRRENDEEAREESMGSRGRVVRRSRDEDEDSKVLLGREREKSAGLFSQLQRKERDLAEVQKSTAMQRAELEHLRGLEEEYQAKLRRQQEEVAKFLGLIKALEEDKERAYALVQQHYQDKLKAEREAASLRIQFSSATNSEEVVKQLRLAIEEKQKLARSSTESKVQFTQLLEEVAALKQDLSTVSRERDSALSEAARMQERLKSLEKATAVTKEWKQRQVQDRRAVQDFVGEARTALDQQYTEAVSRLEEAEGRLGELEDALERCKEQTRNQTGRRDSRVDQLRTEVSQTLNRCADLEAALKLKQEEALSLSSLSKKLKSERDALQQDMKRKDDKLEFLSASLQTHNKQSREAQVLLSAMEQERDQAVQQAQELHRDNKSMGQALDSLEELRESVARAEEEAATLKLSLSHMTQTKAAAEGEIKALKANISDLHAEIREKEAALTNVDDRFHSQVAESEAKWRAAEKKAASGRERQATLESKLEDLTAQADTLADQLQQSEGRANAYCEEIAGLRSQLAGLKGEKAAMSQSLEELRKSLAQTTAEANKKERQLADVRAGTEGEKRSKEQIAVQLQDLKQQLDAAQDQLAAKTEDYAQLETEFSQNYEEMSRLKDQLSALTSKTEAGKRQSQEAEKKRREAEDRIRTLDQEVNRLNAQVRASEGQARDRAEEGAGLQRQVEAFSSQLQAKEKEAAAAKVELQRANAENRGLESSLAEALKAVQSAKAEQAALQTTTQSISSEAQAAKTQLEDLHEALQTAQSDLSQATLDYSHLKSQYDTQAALLKQERSATERHKLKAGNRKAVLQQSGEQLTTLQERNEALEWEVGEIGGKLQRAELIVEEISSHFGLGEERTSEALMKTINALEEKASKQEGDLKTCNVALAKSRAALQAAELQVSASKQDYERLNAALARAQTEVLTANQSAESLQTTVEEREKEAERLANSLKSEQSAAASAQRSAQALEVRLKEKETALTALQTKAKEAATEAQRSIQALEAQVSEKDNLSFAQQQEVERLASALKVEQMKGLSSVTGTQQAITELEARLRERESALSALQLEHKQVTSALQGEQSKAQSAQTQIEALEDRLTESEREGKRVVAELKTEQAQVKSSEQALETAKAQAIALAQIIADLNSALSDSEARKASLQQDLSRLLDSAKQTSSQQEEVLRTALEAEQRTVAALKARLEKSEQGKSEAQRQLDELGNELASIRQEAMETGALQEQQEEAQALQYQELQRLQASLQHEKAEAAKHRAEAETLRRELAQQKSAAEQESEDLERRNEDLQAGAAALSTELEELRRRDGHWRREFEACKALASRQTGEWGNTAIDSIQASTHRLDQLRLRLGEVQQAHKDSQALLQSSVPEIKALIESVDSDFQAKLRTASERLEQKLVVLERCSEKLQDLRYLLSENNQQAALLAEQGERSRLQAELKDTRLALASQEARLTQAQTDLKVAQKKEIDARKECAAGLTAIEKAFKTQITSERDRLQGLVSAQSQRIAPLLSLLEEWQGSAVHLQDLQLQLIDKDEEILRLRSRSEVQLPEEPVFIESDSPLQDENERLRDSLSQALRRAEELEAANSQLQHAARAHPVVPSTFELADIIDEVSSRCEEYLHAADQKLGALETKTLRVVGAVAQLRNMNSGNRAAIKRSFKSYDRFITRQMTEIGEKLEDLDERVLRHQALPESEVFNFAMTFAAQLEEMILERLQDADVRIDRLARTTENVINLQAEEIDQLRSDGRRLDSLGEGPEPLDMRASAGHSIEDVLGAGGDARVCKRTKFLDEVWCLTMVGEDNELYWWREDQYKQFDPRSEEWPEIEEDALNKEIEMLSVKVKRLSDALRERNAGTEEIKALREVLEREGFDLTQTSLLGALQELLEARSQSQRPRRELAAPIDPNTLENEDITVLTDDSGRHPASVPIPSSDEDMAPFVQTLQRLTQENEELGKNIEDLTRQNDLYKQALSRAHSESGGNPDRLTSTVVNLLEMLPEQASNIESVIHVLYQLMLLPKDQVEEVQYRRTTLSGKEDKKKTSWLHRKKK